MTKDELFNHIDSEFKILKANVVVFDHTRNMRVGINGNTTMVVVDLKDGPGKFDPNLEVIQNAEQASKLLDRLAIKNRGKLYS